MWMQGYVCVLGCLPLEYCHQAWIFGELWNWLLQVEDCSSAEKITETPAEPVADRKATKREELEAKLKKLTAEKHRLVQMLKQV
jgi:hypothetical protein